MRDGPTSHRRPGSTVRDVDVDLFDDGGASLPRPARDIIDAARRRLDAAEVRLMFETPLSVFVHHGEVFAAGRWSDALLQAVADLLGYSRTAISLLLV